MGIFNVFKRKPKTEEERQFLEEKKRKKEKTSGKL